MSNVKDHFEKAYTYTDWYDGPRRGVADFNGLPVVYQSEFADVGSKELDIFLLQPISEEAFQHALEDWQIWLRWLRALKDGRTTEETHPLLPVDRQRNKELKAILAVELKIDETVAIRANAFFKQEGLTAPLFVKWFPIGGDTNDPAK